MLPHVLPVEEIPKVFDEWKALQAENIDSSWYEEEIVYNKGIHNRYDWILLEENLQN